MQPRDNAQLINLGTAGTGLNISDGELNRFFTTGALEIGNTSLTTGIKVTTTGVGADNASVLHLKSGTGTITDTSGLSQTNLAITSSGDVILDGTNNVTNLAADINGTADFHFNDTNGFTVSSAAIDGVSNIDTNAGDIHLSAAGLITVTGTVTASSGGGTGHVLIATNTSGNIALGANVTAAGDTIAIDSANLITRTAGDLTATNAMLKAVNGIGLSGNSVETDVTNLAAQVTSGATEGIYINEDSDLNITTVASVTAVATATATFSGVATQGNDAPIELTTTDGTITVSQIISANGSGNILLDANDVPNGSALDIIINADIKTATGDIALEADNAITTDNNGAILATTNGSGTLKLSAADEIGSSTNPIDIDVNNVAASSTGTGDIYLNQTGAVQTGLNVSDLSAKAIGLSGISTNNGDISLTLADGSLTLDNGVNITAGGGNNIILNANGTDNNVNDNDDDVILDGNVDAGATVHIRASRDILQDSAADAISAGAIVLVAGDDIGTTTGDAAINTVTIQLAARAGNAAFTDSTIFIANEAGSLTITNVSDLIAGAGTIDGIVTSGSTVSGSINVTHDGVGTFEVDRAVTAHGTGTITLENIAEVFSSSVPNGDISTEGGAIAITAASDVAINDTIDSNSTAVGTGGGNISIASGQDVDVNSSIASDGGRITINTGTLFNDDEFNTDGSGAITSSGGLVVINANNVDLNGSSSINSAAGNLVIRPNFIDQEIKLGAADAAGTLGLVNSELATLTTTGTLIIGASEDAAAAIANDPGTDNTDGGAFKTGAITVESGADVIVPNATNLLLITDVTISNVNAASILTHTGGGVTSLDSDDRIFGLTGDIEHGTSGSPDTPGFGVAATTLAARTRDTTNGLNIEIHEDDSLIIGTSTGLTSNFSGITIASGTNGNIGLGIDTADGGNETLTINDPITADGAGTIDIDANFDSITQQDDNSGTISSFSGDITISWGEQDSPTDTTGQVFNMAAIITAQGGAGNVTLNYTDNAVDNNLGLLNIQADTLTLTDTSQDGGDNPFAKFGVGGDLLEMNINDIVITGGITGQVEVTNDGDLSIGPITTTTGGVTVTLNTNNTLTIAGDIEVLTNFEFIGQADDFDIAAAVTTSGTGDITLEPVTIGRTINLGHDPATNPGGLDLTEAELQFLATDAGNDVTIGAVGGTGAVIIGFSGGAGVGGVDLSTESFDLTINGGAMSFVDTGTDDINLRIRSGGTLNLNASGAITESNDAADNNISFGTAAGHDGTLNVVASGGIGTTGNPISILAGTGINGDQVTFTAVNNDTTGSSDIVVTFDAEAILNGIINNDQINNDQGNITTISDTITTAADDIRTDGGDISITAMEDADANTDDSLIINANINIETNGGDIDLVAGDDVQINFGAVVQTSGIGTIDIDADQDATDGTHTADPDADGFGDVDLLGTAVVQTLGTGAITLNARDEVTTATNSSIISGGAMNINSVVATSDEPNITLGGTTSAVGAISVVARDFITINGLTESTGSTIAITADSSDSGEILTINNTVRASTVTLDLGTADNNAASDIVFTADPNNTLGSIIINDINGDLRFSTATITARDGFDASGLNSNTLIEITEDVTFNTTGGDVNFDRAIDADAAGRDLTINTGAGNVTLADLGTTTRLGAIDINSTGTTTFADAGGVTIQTENEDVSLDGATDINLSDALTINTNTAAGNILLNGGAVDGGVVVSLNSGTGTSTLGDMGQNTALTSLTVDPATASITLVGNISTTGVQDYNTTGGDGMTLGGDDLTLFSSAGAITIDELTTAGRTINITASDTVTITTSDSLTGGFFQTTGQADDDDVNLTATGNIQGITVVAAGSADATIIYGVDLVPANFISNSVVGDAVSVTTLASIGSALFTDNTIDSRSTIAISGAGGLGPFTGGTISAGTTATITVDSGDMVGTEILSAGLATVTVSAGDMIGVAIDAGNGVIAAQQDISGNSFDFGSDATSTITTTAGDIAGNTVRADEAVTFEGAATSNLTGNEVFSNSIAVGGGGG